MVNIAIVDDSAETCDIIHKIVEIFFINTNLDYRTYIFNNAEHLLLNLNKAYNIILLDIDMPGMNGLETAEILRKNNNNSIIIFVTSQIKYMEKSFGLNIFGFITKNKMNVQLPEVLGRCIDEVNANTFLNFKTNDGLIMIRKEDILYATMEQRKVSLYTTKENYSLNLSTLNEFYERIKGFNSFVYVNRSTIVNLAFISTITNDKLIVLKGSDFTIPISRDKYTEVTSELLNWASKRSLV